MYVQLYTTATVQYSNSYKYRNTRLVEKITMGISLEE